MSVLTMCWHSSGSLKQRASRLMAVTSSKIVRPAQLIIISIACPTGETCISRDLQMMVPEAQLMLTFGVVQEVHGTPQEG
jgi:hypothetical protein